VCVRFRSGNGIYVEDVVGAKSGNLSRFVPEKGEAGLPDDGMGVFQIRTGDNLPQLMDSR
jgi:hypothetical protein